MPVEWEDDDEPVGGRPSEDDDSDEYEEDDVDFEYEVWNEGTGRWELEEDEE